MRYPRRSPTSRTGSTRPERSSHRATWPSPTSCPPRATPRSGPCPPPRATAAPTRWGVHRAYPGGRRPRPAAGRRRRGTGGHRAARAVHDQALFTAQSRVRSVSDYVDTAAAASGRRPHPAQRGRAPAAGGPGQEEVEHHRGDRPRERRRHAGGPGPSWPTMTCRTPSGPT